MALPTKEQKEKFCQLIVNGESKTNAYRATFPKSEKWVPGHLSNQACRYSNQPEIVERIRQLKAELAEQGLWSRQESVIALRNVVESASAPKDIVAAVKELNAMHGYSEQKVRHELGGTIAERLLKARRSIHDDE